ncbi:MAG: ABC transporter ATP-binding protein [Salinisphaera sp.]|jgi:osmoprotectant transport system ATP-binding protein|nr:ABC transporter ATP-binding protein [Salinisphaera sp.]
MIRFSSVTKRFPDGTVAVDDLDLEISSDELTVLVGPSGCGKTTTLRMINRLDEASSGIIDIDGADIRLADRTQLRRGIGYVMQHSGLFPHRTIAANIATVPSLLGWDKPRIAARVNELVDLVGLDAQLATRYPHQLSGGQQQRVGVARALAADPPIMLMDEPFAAVDPIVRKRLQDEFLALQARLKKTIVFVTHDIDEAIRLGDRIAIFEYGGRLAQYASPRELLAAPANDFVADFLGSERELKRLALISSAEAEVADVMTIRTDDSPAKARERAEQACLSWIAVVDPDGEIVGWLWTRDIDTQQERVDQLELQSFDRPVAHDESLRAALGAIVESPVGAVLRVGASGQADGLLTQASLNRALS